MENKKIMLGAIFVVVVLTAIFVMATAPEDIEVCFDEMIDDCTLDTIDTCIGEGQDWTNCADPRVQQKSEESNKTNATKSTCGITMCASYPSI
jgi:hypothetical protein